MEIFGKHIFGETLDFFIELSREQKIEWIKKRTSQQSDEQISEFLNNFKPIKSDGKACLDCGKLDNKIHNPNDRNISKGNEQEVTAVDINSSASGNGKRGNCKRRNNPKNS